MRGIRISITLRENTTYLLMLHEMFHAIQHRGLGDAKYGSLSDQQKAQFVLDNTLAYWGKMINPAEWNYMQWTYWNESGLAIPPSVPT